MTAWHPDLKPGARVAVGLSGGVDSSMSAWLLQRAGCEVIGLTMAIWDDTIPMPDEGRSGCFGPGEARDLEAAAAFAARLGIAHHVIPLAEEYRRTVLDYFRAEYLAGRTPNPCVRCNHRMKFGFLLERARALGLDFEFFATGHYARVERDGGTGRWLLKRSRDRAKDQTYFLSHLGQEQLRTLVLPLGALAKDEVKALAREAGFPELAERPESQDFIESKDYAVLFAPGDACPGPIADAEGRVLGEHRGLLHYTVGQRKGLGLGGAGEPLYVTALDAATNTVRVGRRAELLHSRFRAEDLNWIALPGAPPAPRRADCQIRQRHAAAPATLERDGEDAVRVVFDQPQMSITPGQTAAFYDGDTVLGAGRIEPGDGD